MNRFFLFVCIVCIFIISACANKVPELNDTSKGIIALPVIATNSTQYKLSHYYKIFSSLDSDVEIMIYPRVGTSYVFSKALPPGKYYLDKYSSMVGGVDVTSTKNKSTWSVSGLTTEVYPGAITIMNKALVVEQRPAGHRSWNVRGVFEIITNDEMSKHIEAISKLDVSNSWDIANRQGFKKPESSSVSTYANVSFVDIKEAAEQGFADAQYALGVAYEYGKEVTQDSKTAVMWYQKAKSQGYSPATKKLVKICKNSPSVCK